MVFKFKFQSFVDIQTRADTMQVLQWSVGGKEVLNRCRHLFGAFKYFKLGKISVKLVPASTLPVDPLQLSYAEDDPQAVDPRDQMNPGLVRITNGEDIFTDMTRMSQDVQMRAYHTMMLDPRWSKFMLQSGFRRSAYPLYWQVGQLHQDKYPGSTINVPASQNALVTGVTARHIYNTGATDATNSLGNSRAEDGSSARGLFQVGHRGRLGFLPTDYYQVVPVQPATGGTDRYQDSEGVNNIPEVQVITCVLPKAYKTLYFYRCYITEEVLFSGIRSAPTLGEGSAAGYYGLGLDNFLYTSLMGLAPYGGIGALDPPDSNNGDELP